jgi:hypothetical protein
MVLGIDTLTENGAANLMQDTALTIRIGDSQPRLAPTLHLKVVSTTT